MPSKSQPQSSTPQPAQSKAKAEALKPGLTHLGAQIDQLEAKIDQKVERDTKKFLKKNLSRRTKINLILVLLAVVAFCGYIAWDILAGGPISNLLGNRDELVAAVEQAGVFGPVIYILLQILQTVAAPIPGQIVGGVGGFLFGWWGILWTTIGSVIGWLIVLVLARRFGRPLLEKLFKKSALAKFDFLVESKHTPRILLLILLIPGLPDDMICYLAGLTPLPMRTLIGITLIGRFPTIVITNALGAGASENLTLVVIVALAITALLGLFIWKRDQIISFLRHHSEDPTKKGHK